MHWLGYNDAVSWLNKAKTRIFQPTANFENFKINGGKSGTGTGTGIFRVKAGWGQGRFLEGSLDHRKGTKEYFIALGL